MNYPDNYQASLSVGTLNVFAEGTSKIGLF